MVKENKYEGEGYLIILMLQESLTQQRNEMMYNFSQILRWLPTTNTFSSSNHFGCTAPFKVQVNFHILVFEGQRAMDALDKWLNLLEGYILVHQFFDRENMNFLLLKVFPRVKDQRETCCEKKATKESAMFVVVPTQGSFRDSIKEQYYLI